MSQYYQPVRAIRRKRDSLIDLNYVRFANKLLSDEVLCDEDHKRIKLETQNNTERMDSLLDLITESIPEEKFEFFVDAVAQQNEVLANEIKVDSDYNEEPRIFIARNIFSPSGSQRSHDGDGSSDVEILIPASQYNIVTSAGDGDEIFENSVPLETTQFQSQSNSHIPGRTHTIKEVNELMDASPFTSLNFCVDNCWVKDMVSLYDWMGKVNNYKGCSFVDPTNYKGCLCKAEPKPNSREPAYYLCSKGHRMGEFKNTPILKFMQLQDTTGHLTGITMFREHVENFLNVSAEQIVRLEHDQDNVIKMLEDIRSLQYKVLLQCNRKPYQTYSQRQSIPSSPVEWKWDITAEIMERRRMPPSPPIQGVNSEW